MGSTSGLPQSPPGTSISRCVLPVVKSEFASVAKFALLNASLSAYITLTLCNGGGQLSWDPKSGQDHRVEARGAVVTVSPGVVTASGLAQQSQRALGSAAGHSSQFPQAYR